MPRYIDADALRIDALKATKMDDFSFDNCYPYWQFSKCIKNAPTADVAPVIHAEWIQRNDYDEDWNVYVCSYCNEPWILEAGNPVDNNMNFCPNCGARMDKPHADS